MNGQVTIETTVRVPAKNKPVRIDWKGQDGETLTIVVMPVNLQ